MFVISKFVYDAMGKSRLHTTDPYLKIHNYEPDNHKQTFYRFRFGASDADGAVGKANKLQLRRGSLTPIWSLEGFELSERVLGVFGHASDLFRRGLELVHSPFVDPAFKGQLQLGIRNSSDRDVLLTPGEIIGKVVFFDVSDTILSAEDLLNDVQRNAQNLTREKAIEEVAKAIGKIQASQ